MIRYLILSDIHANWEALQAVLHQAAGRYDRIACLGDFVGYGPDPNRVVEWARHHVYAAVRGNHDRACTGQSDLDEFNDLAREAALWTSTTLSRENADYLRKLPQGPVELDGFSLVHGSPADEDEYLLEEFDASAAFLFVERPITLFGHTHIQGGFEERRGTVLPVGASSTYGPDANYLINPGSVGQPRDRNPKAAYLILSTGTGAICFERAEYPVKETQLKIRAAGLPGLLAERLALGR